MKRRHAQRSDGMGCGALARLVGERGEIRDGIEFGSISESNKSCKCRSRRQLLDLGGAGKINCCLGDMVCAINH